MQQTFISLLHSTCFCSAFSLKKARASQCITEVSGGEGEGKRSVYQRDLASLRDITVIISEDTLKTPYVLRLYRFYSDNDSCEHSRCC